MKVQHFADYLRVTEDLLCFFSQRLVKSHWLQRFNFLPLLREVISSVESALDISQSETNKS